MFDNRDNIDFKTTNIPKLFGSIFIPTLLGMIFNIAFILTDGIFIGQGVGSDGLACVNLVAPLMLLFSGIGMMFAIGASVVVSIHLSQDNLKAARINVTQTFIYASLFSVVIGAIMYIFADNVLQLLGTTPRLMEMSKQYYLWFIPTCLLLMIQTIGTFITRVDGAPKFSMIINIVAAVVNLVFDYIFIFHCNLGLKGAALATDIGGFIAAAMVLFYMLKSTQQLKFYKLKATATSLRLSLRNIGYITKIGFSGFLNELAVSTMMVVGNYMFLRYIGEDGVAAFSVICYLYPIVFMINNSVAQSAQPIISFNYGIGNWARVRKSVQFSFFTATLCGIVATFVLYFFCSPIVSAFLKEGCAAHSYAVEGLPLFTLGFVLFAINIACIGYLQSIEKAHSATFITILRGIIFTIMSFILLPKIIGTKGLWLAVPTADLLTLLIVMLGAIWKLFAKQNTQTTNSSSTLS